MTIEICFTYGPFTKSVVRKLIEAGATSARLTFSYSKVETQLARANEINAEASELGVSIKILGELEGPKIRIGRYSESPDEPIILKSGDTVRFLKLSDYRSDASMTQIPIAKFDSSRFTVGALIAYGEDDPSFSVVEVGGDYVLAKCLRTSQVYATKSLTVLGQDTPEIELDYQTVQQINYMCGHPEFNGIVVPAVRSSSAFSDIKERVRNLNEEIEVWCRVDCGFSRDEFVEILEMADGIIFDRNEIGYSLPDRSMMPGVVRRMIHDSGAMKGKILLASQIADSRSTKERGQLSAAELSDVWTGIEMGIGGFLLTEETAFNENGAEVISQISSLSGFIDRS